MLGNVLMLCTFVFFIFGVVAVQPRFQKFLNINFNVKEICLILKFKFLTDIRYGKVFFANAATSLCLKPT